MTGHVTDEQVPHVFPKAPFSLQSVFRTASAFLYDSLNRIYFHTGDAFPKVNFTWKLIIMAKTNERKRMQCRDGEERREETRVGNFKQTGNPHLENQARI